MAKDQRKVLTRDKIMTSAIKMFGKRGFDATSVQSISEDAGIAHGTIFWHFGSKECLYLEVVKWAGERFFNHMAPLYQRPVLSFTDLVNEEMHFLRGNREISRICFSVIYESLGPHPELQDALKLLNNRFAQIWYLWIDHQERHGRRLRFNDRDNLVRIIVSTVSGVTVNAAVNAEIDALEILEDFGLLIEPAFVDDPTQAKAS